MIKIKRLNKPSILVQKAREWTKALLAAKNQPERKKAEAKYRHAEIKEALLKMCHQKCVYCESKLRHIDYGDIEHYRPKSTFPGLTFEWSNLLLACGECNNNKGDQFPEQNEGGPFINPCDDEPQVHFNFVYDPKTGIASVYGMTLRGETTEKQLGLNRDDLRQYRSEHVRQLHVLVQLAENYPEAKALVEQAKQENAQYAAFIRQLAKNR